MRGWLREITGLVLPAECVGCGAAHTLLCADCRAELAGRPAWRAWPDPVPEGLPPVYTAAWYTGPVRQALLAHKERGALTLAEPLGGALAGAVRRAGGTGAGRGARGCEGPLVLVPVPSARSAVARRGQDAGRRLARAAARTLCRGGVPARVAPVLAHRRAVADQAGLDARQRRANVAGALSMSRNAGRHWPGSGAVVLVDDLMTTGSSLLEAARTLRAAGRPVAGAAVVAVTPREGPAAPGFRRQPELTGNRHRS
ncbi:ComF family protein [Streptomyces sp. NPDC052396]|uniref:ComF family protein n=1 Tax=Streptomyces sp. NPDC052396 TaxID=3365689 RepID=UPI0037CD8F15